MELFTKGMSVLISRESKEVPGFVMVASENGKSLGIKFEGEGIFFGYVGMILLSWVKDHFVGVIDGLEYQVRKHLADKDDDEPVHLLTHDTKQDQAEKDMLTKGEGMVITSIDQIKELARMAVARKAEFDIVVRDGMTIVRAARIKRLRAENSWREIAAHCFVEWGDDAEWDPPTNQLAGMALCEEAARRLGEDYTQEPWT